MHRRHILLRMLVLIVLVVFVFWLGFQLGEMKGFLASHGGFENDNSMMNWNRGNERGIPAAMMGRPTIQTPVSATPVTKK